MHFIKIAAAADLPSVGAPSSRSFVQLHSGDFARGASLGWKARFLSTPTVSPGGSPGSKAVPLLPSRRTGTSS